VNRTDHKLGRSPRIAKHPKRTLPPLAARKGNDPISSRASATRTPAKKVTNPIQNPERRTRWYPGKKVLRKPPPSGLAQLNHK
jgi:hypothetical protein